MFNSALLDTLIACVIVILLLSLVVQTVQATFKKLLKIKSRQIEDSLLDLLEHAVAEPPAAAPSGPQALVAASPVLRMFLPRRAAPIDSSSAALALRDEVHRGFERLGRVSQSGKVMMDSLAREDLMKVLSHLPVEKLIGPQAKARLDELKATADKLKAGLAALEANQAAIKGAARDVLAEIRSALTAVLNDLDAAFAGTGSFGGVVHDVLVLRKVSESQLVALVQKIRGALDAIRPTDPAAAAAGSAALDDVVASVRTILDSLDAVGSRLRARLGGVEQWFDTVMQGFEERYARGMKTWGLVIAFAVVVLLDANFLRIYRDLAGSDTLRSAVMAKQAQVSALQTRLDDQTAKESGATATFEGRAQAASLQSELTAARQNLREQRDLYTSLGFRPMTGDRISAWWNRPDGKWWSALHSLGGWAMMTLLLSAGAPFWQDALESLFGLKNLLRRRSATQNVEKSSGAGQTKT